MISARLGRSAAVLVLAIVAAAGTSSTPAHAAGQACDASAYSLGLQSLTGPAGADLIVRVRSIDVACELPGTLTSVQATVFALGGRVRRRIDVSDVPSPAGVATVTLGRAQRRSSVTASVGFEPAVVLVGRTKTLLRPNLRVRRVIVPRDVLTARPFAVRATIGERNPDVGATATVTFSAAGTTLATATVRIAPRRHAVVVVHVALPAPGRTRIDVTVGQADPAETRLDDNIGHAVLDITDFAVVPSSVLVPSLGGYGGQFNHHVYAAISRSVGVTDANVTDMEAKMRALHPEFSRIFFTPAAFSDPDRMSSFIRTVMLAQSTGTTINITWQGGRLDTASGTVQKFADVLRDLVDNRGVTRLRWLTLQNEPNSTRMTPEQYEAQYRQLDPYIMGIRGQVRYMGGDLVRDKQATWLQYMGAHMSDILDAYSIHVFWDYWDTQKLQDRLTEVRAIVDALPEAERKPLYVAEYGVRGLRTFNGAAQIDPGVWADGTPISATNVSAFQQAWFDVLSSRLGYVATSKWDSYFGKYDNGTQAYYMIGSPQSGWPLYPLYNFLQLLTTTVKRGWRVVAVDQVAGTTRQVTAYLGPSGQRTLVGLDTAGAQLDTASDVQVPYSIGGLPASRHFSLLLWNAAGDGLVGRPASVATDAAGVAVFAIPQNAVFALTTESTLRTSSARALG